MPAPTLDAAIQQGLSLSMEKGWGPFTVTRDLIRDDPKTQRRVGAIVVRGLFLRRERREMDDEVTAEQLGQLLTDEPEPTGQLEEAQHRVLIERYDDSPRKCTECPYTPGTIACMVCAGRGTVVEERTVGGRRVQVTVPCYGCSGAGAVTCPRCQGSLRIYGVRLRYLEDRLTQLDHVFLPSLPPPLYDAVHALLDGTDNYDDTLKIELVPTRKREGPYRDGPMKLTLPAGFDFDAPLFEARAVLKRLRTNLLDEAMECYAVPLLVLAYKGDRHAALLPGRGELLRGVAAAG